MKTDRMKDRLACVIAHVFNEQEASTAEIATVFGSNRGWTAEVVNGNRPLGDKLLPKWAARSGVSSAWLKDGDAKQDPPWIADFETLKMRLRVALETAKPGFSEMRDLTKIPLWESIEVQTADPKQFIAGMRRLNDCVRETAARGQPINSENVDHEHPTVDQALASLMVFGRSTSEIGALGAADLVLIIMSLMQTRSDGADTSHTPMGTLGLIRRFLDEFIRQTVESPVGLTSDQKMRLVGDAYQLLCDVSRKAFASDC